MQKLLEFLRRVLINWILGAALAAEIVTYIIHLKSPNIAVPHIVYILIAIVAIFWSFYKIYLEMLAKIPNSNIYSKPKLKMKFVEGDEYNYGFENKDPIPTKEPLKNKMISPYSYISINVRIENKGLTPVKILAIKKTIEYIDIPYDFMLGNAFTSDLKMVNYPVELNSKDIFQIRFVASIYPTGYYTNAQIASKTRQLIENKQKMKTTINAEFVNQKGRTFHCTAKINISLVPLCELYISHWSSLDQNDLVNLATGK
jgi:hypothetical protein